MSTQGICIKCGHGNMLGHVFCVKCGAKLDMTRVTAANMQRGLKNFMPSMALVTRAGVALAMVLLSGCAPYRASTGTSPAPVAAAGLRFANRRSRPS